MIAFNQFYHLFVPSQAVGASLVYFDLFNASGSAKDVYVHSVVPIVSGAVAVTGLVAADLFLTKTTSVGTGGTAATLEGTSVTACTISSIDNSQPLNGLITARLTPSGGAAAGGVLSFRSVFTEESNGGTYNQITDMLRGLYHDIPSLKLPEGNGIRVVQGGVASVGNIGFDVIFRVAQK